MNNFILDTDGRTPVPCPNVLEWANWFEDADRVVAQIDRDGVRVSTVFLGIDHRFDADGPPLIFETMIFGGEHDEEQWRYSTWDEAMAGHEAACLVAWPEQYDPRDIAILGGDPSL